MASRVEVGRTIPNSRLEELANMEKNIENYFQVLEKDYSFRKANNTRAMIQTYIHFRGIKGEEYCLKLIRLIEKIQG